MSEGRKRKKKAAAQPEVVDPKISFLERQFFEISLENLEKLVGRLRAHCAEVETQYDEAVANFKKLDEDRGDIIAHLKRESLQKSEEINELKERNEAIKKAGDAQIEKLKTEILEMKEEFKGAELRMLSEIKLLQGKLLSLEEFRAAREELFNKFTIQEERMKEQEENYKRIIYELQKEHLIGKNKLRKEMEDKLVQLSTDFQKTTQSRIASTTQNLIRENIAINNELFLLISSWQEIHADNEKLTNQLKEISLESQLTKEQLEKTFHKNVLQAQVIEKLACECSRIITFSEEFFQNKKTIETLEKENNELKCQIRHALYEAEKMKQEKQILEVKIDEQKMDFNKLQCHNHKLERLIHKITIVVKESVGLEEGDDYIKKQTLVNTLSELLSADFLMISVPAEGDASTPTITSEAWLEYTKGNLGLTVKK